MLNYDEMMMVVNKQRLNNNLYSIVFLYITQITQIRD